MNAEAQQTREAMAEHGNLKGSNSSVKIHCVLSVSKKVARLLRQMRITSCRAGEAGRMIGRTIRLFAKNTTIARRHGSGIVDRGGAHQISTPYGSQTEWAVELLRPQLGQRG